MRDLPAHQLTLEVRHLIAELRRSHNPETHLRAIRSMSPDRWTRESFPGVRALAYYAPSAIESSRGYRCTKYRLTHAAVALARDGIT